MNSSPRQKYPTGLINQKALAAYIGVSVATIRRLVLKQKIPVTYVSGKLPRYDLEAVLDALNSSNPVAG